MIAVRIHKKMSLAEIDSLRHRDLQRAVTELGGVPGRMGKRDLVAMVRELLDKNNYDHTFECLGRPS